MKTAEKHMQQELAKEHNETAYKGDYFKTERGRDKALRMSNLLQV